MYIGVGKNLLSSKAGLLPEPDRGIHLCRGASRCQAGSGGALLRAGWGLAGTRSIHGVCEGGRGGGWTAQALRGPARLTAQAGDFRTIWNQK